MTRNQKKQKPQPIGLITGAESFAAPALIKQLATQMETEPFDQITAVTLKELSRMFERKDGIEVFRGTRSSFEEALSLVADILVDKTLYERLGDSYVCHKELFSRLLFRAAEIAGELCERWAGELISELDELEAQYIEDMKSPNE
ncbi:hypothetical protein [Desulfomonile tiedjei]|uniref:Uncharacterized protein n=1 Tax=Desulfomonile tiedjei (strain ATCC 49306 / DSM 6799 / DCB-1) TaxID=706587 RepID=I4CDV7_DESTA|nr:hypothetical protein [Desulfomonile tiedjei]AFM27748.1 hypothetical protein Desti_5145 [Desulfomonile tiedjei DSM 6799]